MRKIFTVFAGISLLLLWSEKSNACTPITDFSASTTQPCVGDTVQFTDLTVISQLYPLSWTWTFPGGTPNSSTAQNPAIVYNTPGIYDVTLTACDTSTTNPPCDTTTKTAYITVYGPIPPIANFTSSPTSICIGQTVTFTDQSTICPDSWAWSFPGGNPSSFSGRYPPDIQYNTPGTYNVSLVTGNAYGFDTLVQTNYVTVLSPLQSALPTYVWAKSIEGEGANTFSNDIAVDNSGNVYITGHFFAPLDYDPGPGTAIFTPTGFMGDAFLVKYDSAGNYIWALQINDAHGESIAIDNNSGNVYLTGRFSDVADFDPGPGTSALIPSNGSGNPGLFVAKYTSAGAYLWAFTCDGGPTHGERGLDIALDGSGNVLVAGIFSGNPDFDPGTGTATLNSPMAGNYFVAKYTSAGSYLWAFSLYSIETQGVNPIINITADSNDDVLLICSFANMLDFDPGPGTVNLGFNPDNGVNTAVAKYSSAGAYIWAFMLEPSVAFPEIVGGAITVDGNNNVLITGAIDDTTDFDPGPGISILEGVVGFVAKYTSAGAYIWAFDIKGISNTYNGIKGYDIAIDGSNNVVVTGSFLIVSDFDPGPCTINLTPSGRDIFVAKYDANGNYLCAGNMGGANNEPNSSVSIAIDDSYIYLTGDYKSTPADFDPGAGTAFLNANLNSFGVAQQTAYIAKYGSCIIPFTVTVTGTNTICNDSCNATASVIPSGGTSPLTYLWSNGSTDSTATGLCAGNYYITVYDAVSDSVIDSITVTEPAIISTNQNATICAGDSAFLQDSWQTTGGTYYDTLISINGCDSVLSTYLTMNPTATATVTATICTGDSIFLQENYQTTSGAYYDTLVSINGCDSIKATTLTVYPVSGIQYPVSICTGDSIFLQGNYQSAAGTYTDTLTSVTGCDSILATTLSVDSAIFNSVAISLCPGDSAQLPDGNWANTAGVYYDTLTAGAGCDSIVQTNLSVNTSYNIPITASICTGDSIFLQGNYQSTAGTYYDTLSSAIGGCDSILATTLSVNSNITIPLTANICTGDSIFLGGYWQTTPGTYYDTLTAVNGCDSILATTLSVPAAIILTMNSNDASCGNADGSASVTASGGTSGYSYLWSNGQTTISATGLQAGTYTITVTDSSSCQQTATVNISNAGPPDATISSVINVTCNGGNNGSATVSATGGALPYSYLWSPTGGTDSTATGLSAGIYTVTITDNAGCIEITDTIISEPALIQNSTATNICTGDSIFLSGSWQTTAGTYYDTLSASGGCDSILTTTLSVNNNITIPLTAAICIGDSIFLQGSYQTTAGTYYDTLTAANGCDSILATTLSVDSSIFNSTAISICPGDSIQLPDGNWANTAGVYSDTLTASAGCDSIVQTNLTVNTSYNIPLNASICTGDSIFLQGSYQTIAGTYSDTLSSTLGGCDSIKATTLTVNPVSSIQYPVSICTGDSIFLQGNYQTAAGNYYDTLTSVNGCDSILAITLSIDSAIFNTVATSICPGDSIQLPGGNWANSAGVYSDTLTASAGCDSIIQTTLTVNTSYNIPLTASICTGDSIFLQGNYQTAAGNYYDTLTSVNGCDSILSITLSIDSAIFNTVAAFICPDDSIQLPGGNWTNSAGVYYDTLTASAGCDSIVQTTLSVYISYNIPLTASICNGDSIFLQGNYQNTAGTYYDTLTSVNGCDSILATTVSVVAAFYNNMDATICQGDSIFLNDSWQNTPGTYNDTLNSTGNCDSIIITSLTVNPVFQIPASTRICYNDSVLISGEWVNVAGTYYDSLLTTSGCDSIIAISLTIDSIPVVTVGNDTTITSGISIQIIATGGLSYLWSNGETSPGITVSPEESTTYYVTVSDANGCAATDSVKITVDISKCTVFVPTIFTPNGDGKNDVLYVRGYGLKELEFMIYDRWGEKVFEYSGSPLPSGGAGGGSGWDGTFRKKEMNTAVFVYMLKAVCFNNELIEEKGNITLVK